MSADPCEIDWSAIERMASHLARHLPAACGVEQFDRVIGISRGGLVPAVLLASALEVKRLETIQVRLYDGSTRLPAPCVLGPEPDRCGPSGDATRTLLVDEMLDSGSTMAFLARRFPEAHRAALFARSRPTCVTRAHGLALFPCGGEDDGRGVWVAEEIASERWILFPWSPPEDRAAVAGGA